MRFLTTLRMALRALRRNTMRSILTALGIIIGVAAVIAMVSIGNGAKAQVQAAIASMGDNLVLVGPGNQGQGGGVRSGAGGATTLTVADADAVVSSFQTSDSPEENNVIAVSPYVTGRAQVLANGLNWGTNVYGVGPDFPAIRSWRVVEGVFFDEPEVSSSAKVAVVGKTIIDNLFPDTEPSAVIGQSIRIFSQGGGGNGPNSGGGGGTGGGTPFRIIGIMAEKGFTSTQDQDDVIYIPYTSHMKRISRRINISQIYVQAKDEDSIIKVKNDLTDLLTQRHAGTVDFTVQDQADITAARTASTDAMTYLLGAIAGVSLLVGGIGIMNIMLVSVTERTREIGIRLALGAHGSDVLTQFLIEAISLSSLGGLVGVALGIGGSIALGNYKGWPVEPSTTAMVIAVGFSAAVGVFFGYYPARKAAQLDPIEALRYE
ncbi:MAG TPA: ABC transporter permease [Opitutaceae bacterium]|nr:ABC transporter permease [Opitutaceae bacterium]